MLSVNREGGQEKLFEGDTYADDDGGDDDDNDMASNRDIYSS